jgi:hypothetical protein
MGAENGGPWTRTEQSCEKARKFELTVFTKKMEEGSGVNNRNVTAEGIEGSERL